MYEIIFELLLFQLLLCVVVVVVVEKRYKLIKINNFKNKKIKKIIDNTFLSLIKNKLIDVID